MYVPNVPEISTAMRFCWERTAQSSATVTTQGMDAVSPAAIVVSTAAGETQIPSGAQSAIRTFSAAARWERTCTVTDSGIPGATMGSPSYSACTVHVRARGAVGIGLASALRRTVSSAGTSVIVVFASAYATPAAQTSRARSRIDPVCRLVATSMHSPVSVMPSSPSSLSAPRRIPRMEAAVAQMQSVS